MTAELVEPSSFTKERKARFRELGGGPEPSVRDLSSWGSVCGRA